MTRTIRELLATPCIAPRPGLSGYKVARCRCATCSAASNEYTARREKLIAYGRWQPLVDAEPVRAHVHKLSAAGIGYARLARLAGLSAATVQALIYGKPGRAPSRTVRVKTASAILAVQPEPASLAGGAFVDATGTRRRTQALCALGWSIAEQARRIGRTGNNHNDVMRARLVMARVARDVARLYDELSGTPAPDSWVATRTRREAQRRGYLPPLAWDDDTIDDPAAQPHVNVEPNPDLVDEVKVQRALAGVVTNLTDAELVAALTVGLDRGEAITALCQRLGISRGRADRLLAAANAPEDEDEVAA